MTVSGRFNVVFWSLSSLLFVFVLLRSWLVPFAHDEVATFFFYIQPGKFIPFNSHVDANGHFLTNALGWICYRIFGSSPFSLRLPSVAAFPLLVYAVYRFMALFRSRVAAGLFAAAFLLLYSFTAYYSLCRGYGISMSFLLLSLFYLYSYLGSDRPGHFAWFVVFMQLALAANLTLLLAAGLCALVCLGFQLRRRKLFSETNSGLHMLHFTLLAFWAAYAFFLKKHGALYYGAGESYWVVTFRSLIDNLFSGHFIAESVVIALALASCVLWIVQLLMRKSAFLWSPASVSFLMFVALVLAFYLLKRVLGVNFPEDRTGLFFFVFFIASLCLLIDVYPPKRWQLVFVPAFATLLVFSAARADLRNHPWSFYETMPPYFYELLVAEQKASAQPVTIAGHYIREFFYGFLNYRSPYKLNHMTSPEALQMNCDYALAVKADKPWYDPWYTELAAEDRWGFRLLKRKSPINKETIVAFTSPLLFEGNAEYFNCFEIGDTVFDSANPLQADIVLEVSECPRPFRGWLVLQVDPADENEEPVFVRVPLDLVHSDWRQAGHVALSAVTGNTPRHVKRIVCYFWNIESASLKIKVHQGRLSRLQAEGINEISQAKL